MVRYSKQLFCLIPCCHISDKKKQQQQQQKNTADNKISSENEKGTKQAKKKQTTTTEMLKENTHCFMNAEKHIFSRVPAKLDMIIFTIC